MRLGLPDSEVEDTGDSKKMVIFRQNGMRHNIIVKWHAEILEIP